MAITGFTLKGQSLRTPAWEIMSVDGWDEYPSWRGDDVTVANRHGIMVNTRRFANSRSISIPMAVFPYNTSGAQPNSPEEHLQENIETLMGLFYDQSLITLVRTMPDTTTRSIQGEVKQAVPITGKGGSVRELVLQLDCPYPFWHGAAISDLGNIVGSFTVDNNGNAPVGDAVFTFSGVATLTHDDTGDQILITSGANTVVDAGARTIKRAGLDVDADFELGDSGYWIELLPGTNNFTLSGAGTVDITGFDSWL